MIPKFDEYKSRWELRSDDSIKPGLASMYHALQLLDHPHKDLNVVHIAGTNGKGSTLAFLDSIAREHGLTVGKFMSPCIMDVHDQIQINGTPILESEMDEVFRRMKYAGLSGLLTDFELLTCAALLYFSTKNVDLVLIEAGMGGREDSTNVVVPILSIIPSIALEHTKFLGPTLESIAYHKAGIIKDGKAVIVGRLPEEALVVVEKEAILKNASLVQLNRDFRVESSNDGDVYINVVNNLVITDLKRSRLLGVHQGENMAIAITALYLVAEKFDHAIDVSKIISGVYKASLPGRFEQVLPSIYFDGAHNPASAEMLVKTIQQLFPNEKIRFVVGILADKDITSVLRILETVSDEFYFVDFENNRAMQADQVINVSNAKIKQVIRDVVPFLKNASQNREKCIVTGSLYLLSEIRQKMLMN
ncbi:bifunctional folylpolyglutamate synthase/dihydrofolate synthase [Ureibacillus sp. NPDC094379]